MEMMQTMNGQAVSDQQELIINYKYSVYDVANYLLHHNTSDFPMTRMRLHTSLYLAYAYFLYGYNNNYSDIQYAMFENKFYADVVSPQHMEIKDFISNHEDCFQPDTWPRVIKTNAFETLSKQDIVDTYDRNILNNLVIDEYKTINDNEFAAVVIGNDAAYKIARQGIDTLSFEGKQIKDKNIYIYYMSINNYDYGT